VDPITLTALAVTGAEAAGAGTAAAAGGVAGAGAGGLGMFSTGMTALGGLTSAVGSLFKGSADSAMYKYKAGIAQVNQQIEAQNAAYEETTGGVKAYTQGLKEAARMGGIRAAQGAGNLDVNRGSAVDVRRSQEMIGELDQKTIRENASHLAYGAEVRGAAYGAEAGLDTMAAGTSLTAGEITAASSLLSSAGSVSSKWLDATRVGMLAGNA
jgi:uncharacterized phage infection (PIP) family protein YhgE